MARPEDVISIADGEIGYYAPDDPEPGSKYGRWMADVTGEDWLRGPSTSIWWCMIFVSWVMNQANVKWDAMPSYNTNTTISRVRQGMGGYFVSCEEASTGDVVIFDWGGDGDTDHVGIIEENFGNYIQTIEGNTSGSDWGSQSAGNGVHRRTRSWDSVACVIRPPYDFEPSSSSSLEIDGVGGPLTIHKWQLQIGTYADGVISGQTAECEDHLGNIVSVEYDGEGSQLVEAIQSKIGIVADGYFGPDTASAIQQWLIDRGYDCGPCGVDGYFGHDSVCALQKSLNDGAWE